MRAYIIRRLLLVIPTIFLVSLMAFFMMRLLPGDIVSAMLARAGTATEDFDEAQIRQSLGLDIPLLAQYGRWIGVVPQADDNFSGIFQGDLGISWYERIPVIDLVSKRWPITFELGLMGVIIAQLIGLPIGIYSALRQDTWGDYIGRSFAILCISIPGFWLGTMVIVFPAVWWGYMPPIMCVPFFEDPIGNLQMFIMPSIILGMAMAGITMRMTRTMMLEVLRQDYIRTAWAKGLKERGVVLRHALKNALIPVITIIGNWMPFVIGGTVIIEQIFCLPGMGRLVIGACLNRDYPLMSGVMLLFAFVIVLINLVIDIGYGFLDPRVHYR